MSQDYIAYIRSKVGQDKIFLNFAAGILPDDKGNVLLQLRGDSDTWGVIGGTMELGESSADTVVREFYEETGIAVEPVRLLNVYTNFETVFPNGDVAQTIGILYEVRAIAPFSIDNFVNEETLKLAFLSSKEIADLELFNQQQKRMLEEYFSECFQIGR